MMIPPRQKIMMTETRWRGRGRELPTYLPTYLFWQEISWMMAEEKKQLKERGIYVCVKGKGKREEENSWMDEVRTC